jgi:hypothetical protein
MGTFMMILIVIADLMILVIRKVQSLIVDLMIPLRLL